LAVLVKAVPECHRMLVVHFIEHDVKQNVMLEIAQDLNKKIVLVNAEIEF